MARLCDGGGGSRSHRGRSLGGDFSSRRGGGAGRSRGRVAGFRRRLSSRSLVGRAVARNVARLRTLVADLASGVQRSAVGSGAVTRDVALENR